MRWVNTWCSPIFHSLFHCHRPAHAHGDTCKFDQLQTSRGARAAGAGPLGHGDGDAGYDALQFSATGRPADRVTIRGPPTGSLSDRVTIGSVALLHSDCPVPRWAAGRRQQSTRACQRRQAPATTVAVVQLQWQSRQLLYCQNVASNVCHLDTVAKRSGNQAFWICPRGFDLRRRYNFHWASCVCCVPEVKTNTLSN
jgi:hypothetical protein